MSCVSPCQTCSNSTSFHSCLSCTNITTMKLTNNSLCITNFDQYWYVQIITTAMLVLFVIPLIFRKRSVVLIKLFDFVQIISYFKFINGYTFARYIWVLMGMRSWGTWSQGWNFIQGDQLVSLWTIQQGHFDKLIRIGCTWATIFLAFLIFGLFKMGMQQNSPSFGTYLFKNITQMIWISFYITVQDMAFILACIIQPPYGFTNIYYIGSFAIGIVFGIVIICMLFWGFYLINYIPEDGDKYHHYIHFFLFSYDYDMFPTYQLLDLPKNKPLYRYSNIRLLTIIFKVAYAFVIVGWIQADSSQMSYQDQIFSLTGFLFCFELAWIFSLPMNIKKQYLNFIILIIGELYLFTMLFLPWYYYDFLPLIIIVALVFWLVIATIIIEGCFNIYKIIPVDMYQTGIKIVIQDQKLLHQLQMRKKQLQIQNDKLKQLQYQKMMLLKKKQRQQRQNQQKDNKHKENKWLNNGSKKKQRQDSQKSLPNDQYNNQQVQSLNQQNKHGNNPSKNQIYDDQFGQTSSMNSQQVADLYKLDQAKKRKVYQWDKKGKFVYSNKMDNN